MILAASIDGVIGYKKPGSNGRYLPWKKLSADMKRFAELTTGGVVVMGRPTWETIPENFRPLPNRKNGIVTRDPEYTTSDDVLVFNSVDDILQYAKLNPEKKMWIIGGAEIYELLEKYCTEIHMTIVFCDSAIDTNDENLVKFLPDVRDFERLSNLTVFADEKNEFDSEYIVFRRKQKAVIWNEPGC